MQLWDEITQSISSIRSKKAVPSAVATLADREELPESPQQHILVIGATNRPQDLDPAIQRRFDRSFLIDPPNHQERVSILKKLLMDFEKEDQFPYHTLASLTEGYYSSDLLNVCQAAVSVPVTERKQRHLAERRKAKEFFQKNNEFVLILLKLARTQKKSPKSLVSNGRNQPRKPSKPTEEPQPEINLNFPNHDQQKTNLVRPLKIEVRKGIFVCSFKSFSFSDDRTFSKPFAPLLGVPPC
jgi:SpoVK/Ycf46/Vps4 family AAA+-type ATPase